MGTCAFRGCRPSPVSPTDCLPQRFLLFVGSGTYRGSGLPGLLRDCRRVPRVSPGLARRGCRLPACGCRSSSVEPVVLPAEALSVWDEEQVGAGEPPGVVKRGLALLCTLHSCSRRCSSGTLAGSSSSREICGEFEERWVQDPPDSASVNENVFI